MEYSEWQVGEMGWGVGWVGRSGLQAVVAVSYEGSALSSLGKRCLLLYNRQRAIPALSCYLSLPAADPSQARHGVCR